MATNALICAVDSAEIRYRNHWSKLEDVSALGQCSSLHTLSLSGCDQLEDVSVLGQCSSLHTLNLSSC
jgi:Leucine-rich repeat (LRR) protein